MNARISELLAEIGRLENELSIEMQVQQQELFYWFEGRKVRFENSVRETHRLVKVGLLRWLSASNPRNLLSAPFIYSMIFPFAVLDVFVTFYQAICFRLYRIPRVNRSRFIIFDQHHLLYLNLIERLNCAFCAYANGVVAYTREVAARTEQYWCPIKHATKILDPHSRYARFSDFGDSESFHEGVRELRAELIREGIE